MLCQSLDSLYLENIRKDDETEGYCSFMKAMLPFLLGEVLKRGVLVMLVLNTYQPLMHPSSRRKIFLLMEMEVVLSTLK